MNTGRWATGYGLAWVLTFIYVQWTNRVYDAAVERIRESRR